MKVFSAIVGAAFVTLLLTIPVAAQDRATLYSPLQYNHDQSRAFFDFQKGEVAKRGAPWDLAYGLLRAGEEFDWFQSSGSFGNRSVIKDLGRLEWTSRFDVPVIEPLPKLKPGERRMVTVDVSGADGADGARGRDGTLGRSGYADPVNAGPSKLPTSDIDDTGVIRSNPAPDPAPKIEPRPKPKRDGKPKIDPMFVKVVVGHIYAIHVVDDSRDYYVLFRVEELTRGDHCTISWRLAPAPVLETVRKQK
jgi:hypothetical protein